MTEVQPITGLINRGLDAAASAISVLLGVALIIAVAINIANVVGRYGFNRPIEGADEVEVYLMVGLAFLGGTVAHIRRRHLRMDVLARRFSPPLARVVNASEALVMVGVCGLMSWVSFNYTSRIWHLNSHSENAHIPMWIPHSMLTTAFTLMTLVGVIRLFVAPAAASVDHPELSV